MEQLKVAKYKSVKKDLTLRIPHCNLKPLLDPSFTWTQLSCQLGPSPLHWWSASQMHSLEGSAAVQLTPGSVFKSRIFGLREETLSTNFESKPVPFIGTWVCIFSPPLPLKLLRAS